GEGGGIGCHVRVPRPECPLADLKPAARETLAPCALAPSVLEAAEVVIERGYIDGLLTASSEEECHRAQVRVLGFVEPALGPCGARPDCSRERRPRCRLSRGRALQSSAHAGRGARPARNLPAPGP